MKTKKINLGGITTAILAAVILSCISCSKEISEPRGFTNLSELSGEEFKQACLKKGLIYDADLNCFVPPSFYAYEHTIIKLNRDSVLRTYENPTLKSGPLSSSVPEGKISQTGQVQAGNYPGGEVSIPVNNGNIIFGVGALIHSGSQNYVDLIIEQRIINTDGSFGGRYIYVYEGPEGNNISVMEKWVELDRDDQIVVGIGIRGQYDVTRLVLYYKQYDKNTNRLFGNLYNKNEGSGTITADWTPAESNLYGDRAVLLGIALTSRSGIGTDAMTINWGYLR